MGGIAGRSDGLAGAVECQKVSGSLHFHFWNFVQRAHQLKTLTEIGDMVKDPLLTSDQLKRFHEHMSCEMYPDEEAANDVAFDASNKR